MEKNASEIRKTLSLNLKKQRRKLGITQAELSEKAGLSEQTVNSIEGMRLWPSDKTLSKICGALDVDAYQLFMPESSKIDPDTERVLRKAALDWLEAAMREIMHSFRT